ncbi:MAG: OmpA family protein [Sneathiella sp.]|nr:OmpA family protein [Sneathiella sp.]
MQCEGITRSGQRCRNKALEDEIFCEIHLRVNHSYNLALLAPFLTTLLFCYFFLFGLFFETLVYGVFDLNYLKYAGLSDLFINMLRNGGMLTVVVLKLWIAYAVILALVFIIWLLVKVILTTSRRHLKPVRRLKIIGISLGIFTLNVLHMFVVLLPRRNRSNPSQILIGREHLVRTLLKHKKVVTPPVGPDPAVIARTFYRRYIAVSTFNNHRFFITLLLLVITSAVSIVYAGHDARKMRACIIKVADRKIVSAESISQSLYPGLNISNLCQNGLTDLPDDVELADKFSRSLSSFFTFPVILLKRGETATPVVYLGSTSRFELFFNGSTRLPFTVSTQNLAPLFDEAAEQDSVQLTQLQEKLDEVQKLAQQNSVDIATSTKTAAQQPTLDTSELEQKLDALERSAAASGRSLQNLEKGLDRVSNALKEVELDHTKRIVATIPAYCWDMPPHLVITFNVGVTRVTGKVTADLIRKLAYEYAEADSHFIVIAGYSDPSGSSFDNYRLSRQRAETVTSIMTEAGLDKTVLHVIGGGEDDSSILPRRRVEIRDCTLPK